MLILFWSFDPIESSHPRTLPRIGYKVKHKFLHFVCVLTLQIIPILHTVRPHCLLLYIFWLFSVVQHSRQGDRGLRFHSSLTSLLQHLLLLALFLLKPLMGMKTSYAPQILRSKNSFWRDPYVCKNISNPSKLKTFKLESFSGSL